MFCWPVVKHLITDTLSEGAVFSQQFGFHVQTTENSEQSILRGHRTSIQCLGLMFSCRIDEVDSDRGWKLW